jgi:hypothetical protein
VTTTEVGCESQESISRKRASEFQARSARRGRERAWSLRSLRSAKRRGRRRAAGRKTKTRSQRKAGPEMGRSGEAAGLGAEPTGERKAGRRRRGREVGEPPPPF